eukprot:m.53085 g.53085  ORF g.53085 m.53085 type:complete len:53 (-) comp7423_c0_seq1:638-796(-)
MLHDIHLYECFRLGPDACRLRGPLDPLDPRVPGGGGTSTCACRLVWTMTMAL